MEPLEWKRIFQDEAKGLHFGHIWQMEFDDTIMPDCPNPGWEQYIRNTSARFRCTLCGRSWPSNRVLVTFHMQLIHIVGTVKVRALRQNCKRCTNAPMVKPSVESYNIKVLMENLMEKIKIKCYKEKRGPSNKPFRSQEVKSPHEPDHCEACKMGICTKE
ncbi:Receptor-transporting protein 3 [Oryzias melastigma]|uniref:Receptor-transporting protein 3 n=1 Tax=Oryzias melastigma TaxID=30732 RepID=A0A834FHY5_ORYME|nr:Receptor-transporting protein 3 [Oryzias melastigma]